MCSIIKLMQKQPDQITNYHYNKNIQQKVPKRIACMKFKVLGNQQDRQEIKINMLHRPCLLSNLFIKGKKDNANPVCQAT